MNSKYFLIFLALFFASATIKAQVDIEQKAPEEVMDPNAKKNSRAEGRFKVGVFLPFFMEGTDTTPQKHAFALSSLDYLAGLKLAVDSIEKRGNVKIDLFIEDTELDSIRVEDILQQQKYRDLDVLIGPIFQSGIDMAETFLRFRKTMMYIPFEKEFSMKSPQKLITSQKNSNAFASFFSDYFLQFEVSRTAKIILIHNGKEGKVGRESKEIDSLIRKTMMSSDENIKVTLLDIAAKENATFAATLDKSKQYLFFINTKNTYYANMALNQIKKLNDAVAGVYCLDEVLESETPLYEVWDSLQVKFFSRFFVNYEDPATRVFRKKIIESYNEEPVEFTYKGFNDLLLLSEIFTEGDEWLSKCQNKNFFNPVAGYYFAKDPANKAIYNGFHGVWQYKNLKLYREF